MPTPVAFFSLPPSTTNSNSTARKSARAINTTNTNASASASTTSPAISDADTFAASDLSNSPAPSSIQFSPSWSAHPLNSTSPNHHQQHLATSVGPTDFTTMASSPPSSSQHQYQFQQQLQYPQQQQHQAQYLQQPQQQQQGASPSHTDADAFSPTASMPAKASSPPLFSHSTFASPTSPSMPNQAWDASASARVISEDNNGVASPTSPHARPPMHATTASATSPIDDYTQFIDFEWDTSAMGSAWNGLDNGAASGGGGGMDGLFGLSPQYQYQYQYGMNLGAGAGGVMGMGMDDLHDDGSTTWKQGQVTSSGAAANENNAARTTTTATTTNNASMTSKRTSLADIFANYSPPLPLAASSPPTLASVPASAGVASHPSSPSLPSPSSPHAHEHAGTATTDMGSASAPNYGHGQQQQQQQHQAYENENFSFAGAAAGMMMVPMPMIGGIGSSMPVPSWFASSPADGAHQQQSQSFLSASAPSHNPNSLLHQEQIQQPQSFDFNNAALPASYAHPQSPSMPPPQHPQSVSYSHQHTFANTSTSPYQHPQQHAFTFSSPYASASPLSSSLSASLSASNASASFDNNMNAFLLAGGSTGYASPNAGDAGLAANLGIAPTLIHNSPPAPVNGAGGFYSPQSQSSPFGTSLSVPWDSGFMEGVDDDLSGSVSGSASGGGDGGRAKNGNALGLTTASSQMGRGRRMRRTTVRPDGAPSSLGGGPGTNAVVSPTSPNFGFIRDGDYNYPQHWPSGNAFDRDEVESNASTRHDDEDEGSDIVSDNDDLDRLDDDDDEEDSDGDYEDGNDEEYHPRRRRRPSHGQSAISVGRRRRVSHGANAGAASSLSFSPPGISASAPSGTASATFGNAIFGPRPSALTHARNASASASSSGANGKAGGVNGRSSGLSTRRQGTIRGMAMAKATTSSSTTTGITIHTANGITYASLPSSSNHPSASLSGGGNNRMSAAYANLIGASNPSALSSSSHHNSDNLNDASLSTSASGSASASALMTSTNSASSLTKRSRGRQVPTVRLLDLPPLPLPAVMTGGSGSSASTRSVKVEEGAVERAGMGERSMSSRSRRRSRIASEADAQAAAAALAFEDSNVSGNDETSGSREMYEGVAGVSGENDDEEEEEDVDSEYDDHAAFGTSSSARSNGTGTGTGRSASSRRSLRASTRNTRRRVRGSTSISTLHAPPPSSSLGDELSGNGNSVIVGAAVGSAAGSMNMSWTDGRTRSYVCRVNGCGKCFQRGEHLKRHIRSIHTNEKPFKCPYPGCNKDFSRRDNLLQHTTIHARYTPK